MNNQGVERWPALGIEHFRHGLAVAGVSAQTVNRFGRKRDKQPCRQQFGRLCNAFLCCCQAQCDVVWHVLLRGVCVACAGRADSFGRNSNMSL